MTKARYRNLIICTLCGIVVLMAIGYAAFSSTLKIDGVSNISSNWDIHLDTISVSNITGDASNIAYSSTNPNGTRIDGTSAIFKTELVSPGDSITYSVVVTNGGSLDASLDSITTTSADNPAIIYSVSGIDKDDVIPAGDSATLTVVVSYDKNVTSQPQNLSSNLTVYLNFVQA